MPSTMEAKRSTFARRLGPLRYGLCLPYAPNQERPRACRYSVEAVGGVIGMTYKQVKNGVARAREIWKVGDYILAGDGPLCICTEITPDLCGRVICASKKIAGRDDNWRNRWHLDLGEGYNRKLSEQEGQRLAVYMRLGLIPPFDPFGNIDEYLARYGEKLSTALTKKEE